MTTFCIFASRVKRVTCDSQKLPNYDILAIPFSFFIFLYRMSVTYVVVTFNHLNSQKCLWGKKKKIRGDSATLKWDGQNHPQFFSFFFFVCVFLYDFFFLSLFVLFCFFNTMPYVAFLRRT
jgi:hypothetical protein